MRKVISKTIFRDYDIRGVYPEEINEEVYYILGRAIATYINESEIAVGFDTRLSSLSLFKSLVKGINEQGVDVVNLGLISTEIHYYASGKYNFPANIIVSASHNPPQYNGLKIVKKGVVPIHGSYGLPTIKKLAFDQKFLQANRKGEIRKENILPSWIKHVLSFINIKNLKPIKVVIDAGNGMGGISWNELKKVLPARIIPLYFKPDGNFPNHLPDPIKKENLLDLKKAIIDNGADLGFALDGDADRIFVLDENGKAISGTITTAILANILLEKYGPSTVMYNVVVGKIVPETVKKFGAKSIRVRVGHSFIKEQMKKNKAIFAGEHSGHFYFRDNFNADSSTIAGLLILEYISKEEKPLSNIVKQYNKYHQSGEINFAVNDILKVISSIEEEFKDAPQKDYIDGLSLYYPNFWFSLRASKTEPLLRLNLEADTKYILEDKLTKIKTLIESQGGKVAL